MYYYVGKCPICNNEQFIEEYSYNGRRLTMICQDCASSIVELTLVGISANKELAKCFERNNSDV